MSVESAHGLRSDRRLPLSRVWPQQLDLPCLMPFARVRWLGAPGMAGDRPALDRRIRTHRVPPVAAEARGREPT